MRLRFGHIVVTQIGDDDLDGQGVTAAAPPMSSRLAAEDITDEAPELGKVARVRQPALEDLEQ